MSFNVAVVGCGLIGQKRAKAISDKAKVVVCFDIDSFCLRNRTYRFKEEDINDKNYLFFSTEAKAEEYILMNKPILSIKEICPIVGQCNNNTYVDLYQLTKKLKELVKSKL